MTSYEQLKTHRDKECLITFINPHFLSDQNQINLFERNNFRNPDSFDDIK
jgi:hypothetical protein